MSDGPMRTISVIESASVESGELLEVDDDDELDCDESEDALLEDDDELDSLLVLDDDELTDEMSVTSELELLELLDEDDSELVVAVDPPDDLEDSEIPRELVELLLDELDCDELLDVSESSVLLLDVDVSCA